MAAGMRPAHLVAGVLVTLAALLVIGAATFSNSGPGGARAEGDVQFRDVHLDFVVPFAGEWYGVEVQFFMSDRGDGSFETEAEAARDHVLSRFPGAIVQDGHDDDGVHAAYVTNGYWWPSRSVPWKYNSAGKPAGLDGDAAAATSAAATWSAAPVDFAFAGGGTTTLGTGACSGAGIDGTNTVGWAEQSGSVLAVTCTWYTQSGNPHTATEFDMQIDPDWNWTTGSSVGVDLQSVLLHEFGHAAGLGHSAQGSAVMYATYSTGTTRRQLTPDDISGAQAIYGAVAAPTPPPATATPTRTPAPPTATPTRTAVPATATPPRTATPTRTAATPSRTATPTRVPTTPTPPRSLGLSPGANLLTWPNADAAPAQALRQMAGLEVVYSWDAQSRTWKRYIPGAPSFVNNLATLKQGNAYWFLSEAPGAIALTR